MDNKSIRYIVIVTILVFILGIVLIYTNYLGHSEKINKGDKTGITTTKKKIDNNETIVDKVIDIDPGVVIVDGSILNIDLKEYQAILGYKISYAFEYFNPVKINTSTLALINNVDNNIFVKIELLSEVNYYNEYNNIGNGFNNNNELDGYSYEYKFIRGNGLYLKITRCTDDDMKDHSNIPIMDFMINSLEIN